MAVTNVARGLDGGAGRGEVCVCVCGGVRFILWERSLSNEQLSTCKTLIQVTYNCQSRHMYVLKRDNCRRPPKHNSFSPRES